MDKDAVVHTHNGVRLSHRKEEILSFSTAWMDLEAAMLSEVSQTEEDKCHLISLICGLEKIRINE